MNARANDFASWRQLEPAAAAGEIAARIAELSAEQRRAVIAWMPESGLGIRESGSGSGSLAGIPYFLKDLFDVAGAPTFAGSTFLPEVRPAGQADSLIVRRLGEAGAVCAGKAHLQEFAYGNTGENPHYGDCRHPRFPDRLTGGSSSGSAAALAAGIVPFAIGTDTGGSIRGPAAFCGLYGYRDTPADRGSAWIADAFPLAPTFDTAGWMTASPRDLLELQSVLIGVRTLERKLNGCYLPFGSVDQAVAAACEAASPCPAADATTLAQLNDAFEAVGEAYSVLTSAEAAQVHSRWLDSHRSRYSVAVWDRIDRGRRWTHAELDRAAACRLRVRSMLASFFLTYDYLVLPAVPFPAPRKAECTQENRVRMLELNAPASLAGLPVLTLPVALGEGGLTAGLQVIVSEPTSAVIGQLLGVWEQ